jgi:DNA-binding HxlR family transcriptional regulator
MTLKKLAERPKKNICWSICTIPERDRNIKKANSNKTTKTLDRQLKSEWR